MKAPAATKPDVMALISEDRWQDAEQALLTWQAPDIAAFLRELEPEARVRLYRGLPAECACEVFAYLDHDIQRALAGSLTEEEIRSVIGGLAPDDRTRLLETLDPASLRRMMSLLPREQARNAAVLLGYPEQSVGRLMSPEFAAVRSDWTIQHALEHIRRKGPHPDSILTIYVTDPTSRLIDALDLSRFVLAEPSSLVQSIMDGVFTALSPEDDRERAVEMMLKYGAIALPVTDEDGILLGVVTIDDVLDVAEEEATEDFQRSANVEPLGTPYADTAVWHLFRKRIPWLAALVLVYLVTSGVIAAHEEALAAQIVLVSFIPLLMGSGGNVGAQSCTLMVRALATGELRGRTCWRVLLKEVVVGSALGLAMALLAAALGYFRGDSGIAVAVAFSMAGIVVVANFFGILLPLVLSKVGVDPAVAGNPLITSFTDVTSLVIYFAVVTRLLAP